MPNSIWLVTLKGMKVDGIIQKMYETQVLRWNPSYWYKSYNFGSKYHKSLTLTKMIIT